jgi:hypothetical protein
MGGAPVAFFSAPLTAGLKTDALYVNWYNTRFQQSVLAARSTDDLGYLLAQEGVEYFVVDDNWDINGLRSKLTELGGDVARIANISVRKLQERYRYSKELLSSTTFKSGWELVSGAIRLPNGSLQVSVESPAYSVVSVQPGMRYRYMAEMRSPMGSSKGRLQVNWLDRNGKSIQVDIEVVECALRAACYAMQVRAPSDAVQALVYASAHDSGVVVFDNVSFRK